MFANDHIVEYPDFTMDGTTTPDISQIRTRTPLPYGTRVNFVELIFEWLIQKYALVLLISN